MGLRAKGSGVSWLASALSLPPSPRPGLDKVYEHSFRIQEVLAKTLAREAQNPAHLFDSEALRYSTEVGALRCFGVFF